jgi:hypothetical protein
MKIDENLRKGRRKVCGGQSEGATRLVKKLTSDNARKPHKSGVKCISAKEEIQGIFDLRFLNFDLREVPLVPTRTNPYPAWNALSGMMGESDA